MHCAGGGAAAAAAVAQKHSRLQDPLYDVSFLFPFVLLVV
jgi:hypothetical protein